MSSFWYQPLILAIQYYYMVMPFIIIFKLSLFMRKIPSRWKKSDLNWRQRLAYIGVTEFAEFWHGYTIHYPKSGIIPPKTLFVSYHSRGTLDLVYFSLATQCQFVIYHLLFQTPTIEHYFRDVGGIPSAKPHNDGEREFIDALVKDERPLMVLPGGVYEMAKRYEDRYHVTWKKNSGFARVLVDKIYPTHKDVCVIPFHTKNGEDLFWQHPWLYTFGGSCLRDWAMRISQGELWLSPFFLTMIGPALGFLLLPRPIKLDAFLGEPIYIKSKESSEAFGERVRVATQQLVDRVQALPDIPQKTYCIYWSWPLSVVYAAIAVYQNASVFVFGMTLAWTVVPIGVIVHYAYRFTRSLSSWRSSKKQKTI